MTDMRNTQKIALGGLLTSLSTVIMVISNIVPSGMYTFPAASGVVIYMISFLAGRSYAWSAFAATSMISFVFCTNKEASLCFIMLMGYYPMLKEHIEKIKLKFVQYLLKLAVFNAAAVLMYYLLLFVFSVPAPRSSWRLSSSHPRAIWSAASGHCWKLHFAGFPHWWNSIRGLFSR